PAVLPSPEPGPRPRRLLLWRAPGPGCRSFNLISGLFNLEHVANPVRHAAIFGGVGNQYRMVQAPQSQPADARMLLARTSGKTAHQRNPQFFVHIRHDLFRYAVISSTVLPRLAAMYSGSCMPRSPLMVARTMLIGLREP